MLNIAIYDPRNLSEDAFVSSFVARADTVDFLVEQLRRLPSSGEVTHRLIVGQRGMGKTSLLRRLAIAVARDHKLAESYVPLTFREEQYNVRNIEKFWRNCIEALAEWLEQTGQSKLAAEIDRCLQFEKWANSQAAYEYLISMTASLGKRPILLVDNLDLVLDAIPAEEHWEFRRILQDKRGPILFGASTQFLRQSGERSAAFYEFFHVLQLEALTEAELIKCMYRLVETRGDSAKPVRAILDNEPARLRVLHTLTGGNPRVLVLIYQLLERADSESVFIDLEALLDQLTPFYKSRVEELKSDLQRAIVDAIALHWDPITTNHLSKITGVEVTTLSPQLQRLRRQGLVEEVPTSGARSGYQIVERFLNIWYLMRHGTRRTRSRMRWLAAFLQSFYSVDQLRSLRKSIFSSNEQSRWRPLYDEAILVAMEKMEEKLPMFPEVQPIRSRGQHSAHAIDNSSRESESELRAAIAAKPSSAAHWNRLAKSLASEKRALEAESAFRRAVELSPGDATYWYDLGRHLGRTTEKFAEAEVAYRRSIEIEHDNAARWSGLAQLLMKAKKHEEAESAFQRSIELDPRNELAWIGLGTLLQYEKELPEEAEKAYRMAIELNARSAIAWHSLGRLLENSFSRYSEAEAALRRTIDIDPLHDSAWDDLGDLLMHRYKKYSDAELIYRQALKKNPKSELLLTGLGHVLGAHLDRKDEAEATFREAVTVNPRSARTWRIFGNFLGRGLSRFEEAEAALRKAIEIDPKSSSSWDDLGDLLLHLERDMDAEAAYRNALEARPDLYSACRNLSRLLYRRGQSQDAEQLLRSAVDLDPQSRAWADLADLLSHDKARYEEAEDAFHHALECLPGSARIQTGYAMLLAVRSKFDEAEAVVRRAIEINPMYARAWNLLGMLLVSQSRNAKDVEAAFRKAVDLAPNDDFYWYRLGLFLADRLDFDEAGVALRRCVELNPERQAAWMYLGNMLLDHLGQTNEAIEAYTRAIVLPGNLQVLAKGNLFWLRVQTDELSEAQKLRGELGTLESVGLSLADAAIELARDNFGAMTEHLRIALADEKLNAGYFDDLLRLLRLVKRKGYGSRLLDWMKQTSLADAQAPVYVAFLAFIEGHRLLLDFAPEIRKPAQEIYAWLTGGANKKNSKAAPKRRKKKSVSMH